MVLANAGTRVVRLLKLVSAFCSMVSGCSRAPRRCVCIFQADSVGCHIITATNDVLAKLALIDKDLHEYSLETVKMFRDDAVKAGFLL